MQQHTTKFAALDSEAGDALRIIGYIDTLVEGRGELKTLVQGSAAVSGSVQGVHAPAHFVRVENNRYRRRTIQPVNRVRGTHSLVVEVACSPTARAAAVVRCQELSTPVSPVTPSVTARMTAWLNFGCVCVNTHVPLQAEIPHGGLKRSGNSKDLSTDGIENYTRIKEPMSQHAFLTRRGANWAKAYHQSRPSWRPPRVQTPPTAPTSRGIQ